MLDQSFINQMEGKLRQEKATVKRKIKELTRFEKPKDNPDLDDLALDAQQDIINDALVVTYRQLLAKIEKALVKIKEGTYGKCEKTNKNISREMLAKEPWAEFC